MDELRSLALKCVVKCCAEELTVVLGASDPDEHYGVPLNFISLADCEPTVAQALLAAPSVTLGLLDDCLPAAQQYIQQQLERSERQGTLGGPPLQALTLKDNVHIRVHSLPSSLDPRPSTLHPPISLLGSAHLDKLVTIQGTVVRTGPVRMYEHQQVHECTRCKHRFAVRCPLEGGGAPELPGSCPRPDKPCAGQKFRQAEDMRLYTSIQEVKVQEKMQCLAMGALPCAVTVVLQDELADSCKPGDDVSVTGVVTPKWKPFFPGARCDVELHLVANHLQVAAKQVQEEGLTADLENMFERLYDCKPANLQEFWAAHPSNPFTGRNKILAAICPQIYGLFLVKLAAALVLVGGVPRQDERGSHIRGEVHMLMVGDPGTGKSQIMKFSARASHRSVVTTGRSSSGAGLTVSAVKDSGQWSLEAGALVLADGGICCIDEFDGIKESERAVIHEAMEQQTVHVAKAGLVTCLSTRTAVLAAINPKPGARLGPGQQSMDNLTRLSGPLLSRFDLLLLLADTRSPQWDQVVSGHVLENHQQSDLDDSSCASGWTLGVLQRYFVWAKRLQPTMSPEAESLLLAYYRLLRGDDARSAARSTIRMLESLVRVAQAHARLMASPSVLQRDAVVAIQLVDSSQQLLHLDAQGGALNSHFPLDPEAEQYCLEMRVLHGLGMAGGVPRLMSASGESNIIEED